MQNGVIALDGEESRTVVLPINSTHTFETYKTDNYGSTFKLSTTEDGTHNSGSEYTTGVTSGTFTLQLVTDTATPSTLYYYADETAGMGGKILIDASGLGIVDGVQGDGYYCHMEVSLKPKP